MSDETHTPTEPAGAEQCWRDDQTARPNTIARLEKVLEILAVHGVIETACRQARCSKKTFYEFRQRHPDFAGEADEATRRAVSELEATGWAAARKGLTDPRYLSVLIFALKAKAGWKETTQLDLTSPENPGKDPREMTDDELVTLIKESRLRLDGEVNA